MCRITVERTTFSAWNRQSILFACLSFPLRAILFLCPFPFPEKIVRQQTKGERTALPPTPFERVCCAAVATRVCAIYPNWMLVSSRKGATSCSQTVLARASLALNQSRSKTQWSSYFYVHIDVIRAFHVKLCFACARSRQTTTWWRCTHIRMHTRLPCMWQPQNVMERKSVHVTIKDDIAAMRVTLSLAVTWYNSQCRLFATPCTIMLRSSWYLLNPE